MGEAAAGAVLNFFLDYSRDYIQYNVDLIGGTDENVRDVLKDITGLKKDLEKWTNKSNDSEYLEVLADAVRDVISQAEDVTEKYIVYKSRHYYKRSVDRFLHKWDYLRELRQVGEECSKVKKKIEELYKDKVPRAMTTIGRGNPDVGSADKKRTSAEDKIIGLLDAAEKVKELLTGESEEQEVHSIVGMLGLGKTTLARKVYNDPEIKYRFFARAFVIVSKVYEKKEVFLQILDHFEAITDEISKMSEATIRDRIHAQLEGKSYLIVLDDVWDREVWDHLKEAFPLNKKQSRILITTRHSHVARHANQSVEPYMLDFMKMDDRKELLRWKVFGKDGCPPDLETHIENYEILILHRSGGLPLALVVIAGILLNQKFIPEQWKEVSKRVENYDHANEKESLKLIRLSYTSLPYYIKPCFLYLGIFPEDFAIPVWKLLRLWVAEGFIQGNGQLEGIAERYLEELVDRNLVMVANNRLNGRIKSCRVHDFLREFCKNEAISKKVFQEIKETSTATRDIGRDDYLRIAVNSDVLNYVSSKPSGERVRSFLSFPKDDKEMPAAHISTIPKAFHLLRVLDIRALNLKSFPAEIYYLILLKYIAISCDCGTIASKLTFLWNLQTIIFETKSRTLEIKADISQMEQLRHLHTNTSASLPKIKDAASTSTKSKVQTMSTIAPESCTREFFDTYKELKKLGVRGNLDQYLFPKTGPGFFFENLSRLVSLEHLKLLNEDVEAKLYSLPDEKNFPSTLTRLTLWNTSLEWKHMSTLAKLENLKILKLKDNAFVGEFWDLRHGGFSGLMVLHIGKTNLIKWTASAAHFPSLTTLILKYCTVLNGIPRDFAKIGTLQTIDLHWTNSAVVTSAKDIKVLKLEMQQQHEQRPRGFTLGVYPPES